MGGEQASPTGDGGGVGVGQVPGRKSKQNFLHADNLGFLRICPPGEQTLVNRLGDWLSSRTKNI